MPLPTVRATIVAPEPLVRERSFLRLHNRCAKEALRDEGTHHWKTRIPRHFTRAAHAKYGYQPRNPRYMRFKARRYRSVLDLVKKGQLREEVTKTPPVMRIGGKAADDDGNSGELKLTMVLPFHIGDKAQAYYASLASTTGGKGAVARAKNRAASRTGVTIAQMRKELAAMTEDEGRETARRFLGGYGRRLSIGLARAPRIRKRVRQITSARS